MAGSWGRGFAGLQKSQRLGLTSFDSSHPRCDLFDKVNRIQRQLIAF
jgi:hypothetical protein